MKKIPLNLIGMGLTAVGAVLTIAQAVVSDKQQKETIAEEVKKALANK